MYFLFYVDRVNISTAALSIQRDLHLSNVELGFAFSAFAYPYAFFQIFGGWIADRLGPRRTLLWGGLLVAITTMATGLVGGLGSLFVVRLLLGFGEGAAFPTATRAMATWVPASARGWAQGVTHSASRLGNAITPPLVSALILAASWRVSFAVVGRDQPAFGSRSGRGSSATIRATIRASRAAELAGLHAAPAASRAPADALARADPPHRAGDDGRFLLRLDAVDVPELAAGAVSVLVRART